MKINYEKTASFDIDCQKGFTPLCPLELVVPDGHLIVDELNAQAKFAKFRIGSKDIHPSNALWLANDKQPQYTPLHYPDVNMAWNAHCMSGTYGAELLDGLPHVSQYDYFLFKGCEPDLHPYSPVYHDLGKKISTGVIEWLRVHNVTTVIVGGLALNFCMGEGAIDLAKEGFRIIVNLGASRGLGTDDELKAYVKTLTDIDIAVIESASELEAE